MVFNRHPLAHVVQQQRKNQQIAALHGLPQRLKMCPSLIGRIGQFLQVLDGAQRVFVHGVAMIEVPHNQGIDTAELRQNLGEQPKALHRT